LVDVLIDGGGEQRQQDAVQFLAVVGIECLQESGFDVCAGCGQVVHHVAAGGGQREEPAAPVVRIDLAAE